MNSQWGASYPRQRFTLKELLAMIVVFVVLLAVMVPATLRFGPWPREKRDWPYCPRNLKQIGLGMLMYSGDNGGFFCNVNPNGGTDWCPVGTEDYITSVGRVWSCPTSATIRSYESWSSYRYVGSGLRDDDRRATVVSLGYDLSGNHPDNQWMNVLFVDGHVEGAQPGTKWRFRND